MKTLAFRKLSVVASGFGMALSLGMSAPSFAQEAPSTDSSPPQVTTQTANQGQGKHHHRRMRRKMHRAFAFGVCVGQGLAQAGVTLPAPQAGQKPTYDDATKAAIKAAAETCKAQFKAAHSGGGAPTTPTAPANPPATTPPAS